ncbi:MAG: iron-containing alcohol dehydrogenase [Alphaproteobacteria bacterium]|nr:iron-containing alcohol dehydrogenase [Alphaproteobacteria bacterium]
MTLGPGLPSRYGSSPARVVEGEASAAVAEAVAALASRQPVVLTDGGVAARGAPARVAAAVAARLGVAEVRVHVLRDGEPDEARVADAADLLRTAAPDALVAVGGGSVLDTAKAAGFLLADGGRMEDWWGFGRTRSPHLPLIAVPTTAGTGSEVQSFALVSRDGDHRKMACGAPGAMPRVAVLDPALTASAPRRTTILAGLDALVHALETAVTTVRTPASAAAAAEAFALIWPALPRVAADPHDLAARTAMLRGSCRAGQAIEASMLGAAHALANPVSARWGVPHGLAVATMAPGVIRFNAAVPEAAATCAALAASVGLGASADALAAALEGLLATLGVAGAPSAWTGLADALEDVSVDAAGQWTAGFNPRPLDEAAARALYLEALEAAGRAL